MWFKGFNNLRRMKRYITWDEVFQRIKSFESRIGTNQLVYGIPKGGMIAAGFLKNNSPTTEASYASVFLDDLIDSGATKEKYAKMHPGKPFIGLFDKEEEGITDWLIFPWEKDHPMGEESIEQNIVRILQYLGEDVKREGLLDTPKRVVKSWEEIYGGYRVKPASLMTVFENDGFDEVVLLKNIEFHSTCEHHMLPFSGKAHVAYIPDKHIIGVSKLARLVDAYARRLQIQERIGKQVVDALMDYLNPLGAACIIEAQHSCMKCRGANKQESVMVTSSLAGVFRENTAAREELMQLLKR